MNKKTAGKIAKKHKRAGQPTKYNNRYCQMLVDHFSGPEFERYIKSERITIKKNGTKETWYDYGYRCTSLPTFSAFASKINVDDDTINNWADAKYPKDYSDKRLAGKHKHPKFFGAYNKAKALQKAFLVNNGLKGYSPPAAYIFTAKNITDMRDKQEVDHTTKGKEIVGIDFIIPNQNDGKNTNAGKSGA